jgi:YidC/Oxa1 family membrane protein insertase
METMQLFRSHKVNPMGGCLPMLLQFPIYIALYKVLWGSIELYRAPFFWFYKDLSAPDPYLITPILLGIGMVFQQKLMPSTSADPAQQKMMMFMPIMFSVFMLFLPVGLVIYILVNTAMSVTQQMMYNKNIRLRDLMRGRWQPTGA